MLKRYDEFYEEHWSRLLGQNGIIMDVEDHGRS